MSTLWRKAVRLKTISTQIAAVTVGLLLAVPAYAQ
jgi:1,4-dihydroxy-2-naphthoate octaprenyltransferase